MWPSVGDVGQLLAAGGLGGIAAQYLTSTNERRRSRRELIAVIRDLDENDAGSRDTFQGAAVLAGVPWPVVAAVLQSRRYRRSSESNAGYLERKRATDSPDPVLSEQMNAAMLEYSHARRYETQIQSLMADFIWRPWFARVSWRARLLLVPRRARKERGGGFPRQGRFRSRFRS